MRTLFFAFLLLGILGAEIYQIILIRSIKTEAGKNETVTVVKTKPVVVQNDLLTTDTVIHTHVRDSLIMVESKAKPVEALKKDLEQVYISMTKSMFAPANITLASFQAVSPEKSRMAGKSYYHGENGAIESDLVWDEDGNLHEQLVSFDLSGRPVDNLEIGVLTPSARTKYASLSTNKISIVESVQTAKKNDERVTEYTVTPELQFHKGKTYLKIK
ncbi:MAG: hypothetical protein LBG77_03235 [Dysgonamonadaceae bacterium]|nr:hypothetical protein [Dysgonamonadaceae bacterium]